MSKLFKIARLLFYFFITIIFFFVGIYIAKLVGAGKNQMLAAGAIVLFYGLISAGMAFILALLVAHKLKHNTLIKINKILGIVFFLLISLATYKFITHEDKDSLKENPKKTTTPIYK